MNKLYLWARRFDAAYGWRWHNQRDVSAENAEAWLNVFRKDEPTIVFTIGHRKPKI